jgi:hypothetical protein
MDGEAAIASDAIARLSTRSSLRVKVDLRKM